jgi:hypothetical protein
VTVRKRFYAAASAIERMRSSSVLRVAICVLLVGATMAGTAGVAIAVESTDPAEAATPTGGVSPGEAAVSVGDVSPAAAVRAPIRDSDPDARQVDFAGFDRSAIEITVDESGRGDWTLRYERTLRNESERDDFQAFADRFNDEETDLYRNFQADATGLAEEGENVTDREMAAANFSREAFVDSGFGSDVGVIELSFAWQGFAAVDGDVVTVGDVFEGGFYLGPDQELVVRPGGDLSFVSRDPEGTPSNPESLAESASITWQGERRFTDRRPRVVFARNATNGTASGSTSGGATDAATALQTGAADDANTSGSPTEGSGTGGNGSDPLLWGVLGAAVILAAAIAIRTGSETRPASRNGDRSDPVGGGPSNTVEETSIGGSGVDETTGTEDADTATATATAITEAEMLSDEDRIESILRGHGGRVKQTRIVEETDWSKSKVSVVLSRMADDGTVSKLRIGRENVITLEGPDADDVEGTDTDDADGTDSDDEGSTPER